MVTDPISMPRISLSLARKPSMKLDFIGGGGACPPSPPSSALSCGTLFMSSDLKLSSSMRF